MTATRVCFLVVRTSSVELGRRTCLRVEGLHARIGFFVEGSMTTRLEVQGIVSVAGLGKVEFVSAAWGPGLWDMVDFDMGQRLRHCSCMTEGSCLRTLMMLVVGSAEKAIPAAGYLLAA